MENVTGQTEKQFPIMAQTNLEMQKLLAELTQNMTTMSQILFGANVEKTRPFSDFEAGLTLVCQRFTVNAN